MGISSVIGEHSLIFRDKRFIETLFLPVIIITDTKHFFLGIIHKFVYAVSNPAVCASDDGIDDFDAICVQISLRENWFVKARRETGG